MKRSIPFTAIVLFIGFTACQTEQTNTNVLSEEQKQKIIIEIDSLWNYSGQGIENLDAHQAFSVCTPDARYIRDAYLYDNI